MKSVWCQLQWKTWCFTAACAPVKMKALIQASYFHPGELMGHTNFADCRWFFADQACQRDLLSWQSRRADPQNAAQSADRTPCCPGGIDDHWYSDSFEEVEAVSGCSPARNHNSHAHVHACCSFVRGSLGSAAHSQNRKLQERTNHGLVQAWSRHWNVLGEHCSQHGGTGKSRCARPGCAVILFASCWHISCSLFQTCIALANCKACYWCTRTWLCDWRMSWLHTLDWLKTNWQW